MTPGAKSKDIDTMNSDLGREGELDTNKVGGTGRVSALFVHECADTFEPVPDLLFRTNQTL
jgi:hypothetical protein